jgi:hypothetical protein
MLRLLLSLCLSLSLCLCLLLLQLLLLLLLRGLLDLLKRRRLMNRVLGMLMLRDVRCVSSMRGQRLMRLWLLLLLVGMQARVGLVPRMRPVEVLVVILNLLLMRMLMLGMMFRVPVVHSCRRRQGRHVVMRDCEDVLWGRSAHHVLWLLRNSILSPILHLRHPSPPLPPPPHYTHSTLRLRIPTQLSYSVVKHVVRRHCARRNLNLELADQYVQPDRVPGESITALLRQE